jgi:hypothetical protein
MSVLCLGTLAMLAAGAGVGGADDKAKPTLKAESFDRDPGWEGFNNRIELKKIPTVTQDYGYSATKFAAKEKGELGGRVQRSTTPSYYAEKIAPKTLNDKLTASGTFALAATGGNSGVFFGWFNADQPGGSGRPIGSLGFDFDGEKGGGRLAVRLINGNNKSCGTFVTPFIPGKFRPTPIKNDGTRYAWTLDYDPDGNGGTGRFQVTVKSDSNKPEEFEGKTFTVDLPAGFKKEGATFDRFGMMNLMKSGGPMTLYFGDLKRDGKALDLSKDPGWVGSGNRARFEDREQAGAHDFGYSAKTNFAGGKPGEIGGSFWRTEKNWGYYADKVGPLTFGDRLEASGRVVLKVGAPDSDMFFGWFDADAAKEKDKPPQEAGPFVGVHIGGPTRVGHYFLPTYTTAKGTKRKVDKGPILQPGKTYEWKLVYDPTANGGKGSIQVTLGEETVTLALKEGDKAQGGRFGRFGLCTGYHGGQLVKVYFDDLKYTAGAAK